MPPREGRSTCIIPRMFELRGVSKLYDGVAALRGVDLSVAPRETTVLIGPSGCGKSTILRLMTGLIRADEGAVLFEGVDLSEADLLAVRRRIGYVIQEGGLFPHLTAGRNASIVARYLRWERAKVNARLTQLAELVRLQPAMLDRLPVELSGGQRQRVGLMRALMLDPDVLLLDEPLGALDPIVRHELQQDLKQIFRQLGKTVVLVTHDLGEAAYFGDEVVLLREGRTVQRGTPAELLNNPADEFARRFVNAQRPPGET
jgi:osmoprotectant transport system ATP-binding protein